MLRALGRSDELAHSSLRMTIGRFTTEEEIDYVISTLKDRVAKLRDLSPLWDMYQEGIDISTIQWAAHGSPLKEKSKWHTAKSRRALRKSAQRRLVRQGRRDGRHRHGGRARLRRRDEAADQGQPETGLIEDAKFKTYGCGSAIASSSLVTEWVKGKSLDEALTIKNTHIAEELALPPVKIHCSILAEDAIKAAVE